MAFEETLPDELPGGNFVELPGTYHMAIIDVDEEPQGSNGMALEAFEVSMQVLAGTEPTQVGKTIRLAFFRGKASEKDGGKFNNQKRFAFYVAANLVKESDRGKPVSIDLESANGQQVMITLEKDSRNEKYLRLAGANVFHVHSDRAARFPRDEKFLKNAPPLVGAVPHGNGNGSSTTAPPAAGNAPSAGSSAPAGAAAFDDV